MKRHVLMLGMVLQIGPVGAQAVFAQEPSPQLSGRPVPYEKRFATDFRLGGTWSSSDAANPVSVGGSLTWHPSNARVFRRVGFYVTVDYRHLERSVASYPCAGDSRYCTASAFGSNLLTRGATSSHWLASIGGMSLDLIRTRRFSLEARGGGGSIDEFTTFALQRKREVQMPSRGERVVAAIFPSVARPTEIGGEFEDQCSGELRDLCSSQKTFASQWGLGARFWDKTGTSFVGVDYARLRVTGQRDDRHQLVGTVGFRFPFRVESKRNTGESN